MSDTRYYGRAVIQEFIALYKKHTCLWKYSSKEYTDRNLKEIAVTELTEKLREVEKNATREMALKKLNSLRTSFRREYKKVEESKRSGTTDDIYEPRLWYYDLLLFIDDQDIPCTGTSVDDREEETEVFSSMEQGNVSGFFMK
ncbi:hypothetical protein LSTR_LSTR016977, partial [Laodelphax striatellus]